MLLLIITLFCLTGYNRYSIDLILCCTTLCIFFLSFSLCHVGNGHSDLGHHMGVPKLLTRSINSLGVHSHLENKLTWSINSLGVHSHLENKLTWSIHSLGAYTLLEHMLTWKTYLTWRTITMLTILITLLFTIKCWLLSNRVFKLRSAYKKLWTWSWKHNSTHQIGGGNKSITWTFAEIK